jgi:hypothetical protein
VIHLTRAQYEEIRQDSDRFVVRPGHWSKRAERRVREGRGYEIVERLEGDDAPVVDEARGSRRTRA